METVEQIKVTDVIPVLKIDSYGNQVPSFEIHFTVNKLKGAIVIDDRDIANSDKPYDLITDKIVRKTRTLLEDHDKATGLLKILKKRPIEIEIKVGYRVASKKVAKRKE